jgi:signal transduction histidine kinase/CheY-like chemotaxis protein
VERAQSLFPILIATGLSIHVFIEVIYGGNDIDVTLLAQSGLKVFPLMIFFVLRDTKFSTIAVAWAICLISLSACCVYTQSFERFTALLSYFCTTCIIFYDSLRQYKDVYALIDRLQETLVENERLAVEAQALELRAMIGNVAHDLKTVSRPLRRHHLVFSTDSLTAVVALRLLLFYSQPLTSILSGIECMTEVVGGCEKAFSTSAEAGSALVCKALESVKVMRGCIKNVHGCTSFMTMTINRCIDYTKASKGVKLVPKMATTVLQDNLSMPVDLMRNVQSTVEIKLSTLDAGICTHIITDNQWLIENLLCLLSNAVKYSHKGTVEVGVSLEGAASEPQFLRFEVQDSGVGLSEEAMQTLFNPFKQAQRLAGGTGLGLFSLAKRVEALNGQYGVNRRPDSCQGSVFWFTIPYRPDQQSAKMSRMPSFSQLSTLATAEGSLQHAGPFFPRSPTFRDSMEALSVLVVDDAPMIVKMTTMLLSRKGHTVESAVNGADALEKLLQGFELARGDPAVAVSALTEGDGIEQKECTPYDVVLMDLQMPVLDGIEAIKRLRAEEMRCTQNVSADRSAATMGPRSPHQLVIALSANSDEETRLAALEAGADAFMPKPFTYENFQFSLGVARPAQKP